MSFTLPPQVSKVIYLKITPPPRIKKIICDTLKNEPDLQAGLFAICVIESLQVKALNKA